jgi:hypothetical protein
VAGCERALPTEPDRGLVERRQEVAQPSMNLAGRWNGTVTFHPVDENIQPLSCNGSDVVSLVLTEDGTLLTGRFRTDCSGELQIRGVVNGDGLSGSLDADSGISLGSISGSVSSSRIAFRTLTRVEDDQLHKGQPPAVSSEIELHRQMTTARGTPILAGGGTGRTGTVSR